jgi:hypothetical protein
MNTCTEMRCIHCGAGAEHLYLLNTRGEYRGGAENYYYRCGACKRYQVECCLDKKVKMVRGA